MEAILKEAFRLRYEQVSSRELEKARLNVESDTIYSKETVQGQARKIGAFEIVAGDLKYEDTYYRKVSTTTPADIKHVAQRYLTVENLTAGLMLPNDKKDLFSTSDLIAIATKANTDIEAEYASKSDEKASGPISKVVLPNGATLLIKEDHSVPLIAIRTAYLGGGRYLDENTAGLS